VSLFLCTQRIRCERRWPIEKDCCLLPLVPTLSMSHKFIFANDAIAIANQERDWLCWQVLEVSGEASDRTKHREENYKLKRYKRIKQLCQEGLVKVTRNALIKCISARPTETSHLLVSVTKFCSMSFGRNAKEVTMTMTKTVFARITNYASVCKRYVTDRQCWISGRVDINNEQRMQKKTSTEPWWLCRCIRWRKSKAIYSYHNVQVDSLKAHM